MKRSRSLPAKLALLVTSTLFALGLAELVIRVLRLAPPIQALQVDDPLSPYQRSTNPVLRYELKPGFQGKYQAQHGFLRSEESDFRLSEASTQAGIVTVNSHGLRDRERQLEKPDGVRRIILLGDSVVELVNYGSDELTISRLLEEKFEDGQTEVLNCGTAGYCTRSEVELLRVKGIAFQPDLVCVLFVENDFWGFNLEHAIKGQVRDRPPAVEWCFKRLELFRLAALQLNLFHFRDEFDSTEWHRQAMGENNVVDGFRLLRELSEEHDFEVIVGVWPSFKEAEILDPYPVSSTTTPQELIVEKLAWSFGFPTVRLSRYFRQDWETLEPRQEPEWYYTCGDGMHPSPVGCRLAANALYRVLTEADPTELRQVDGSGLQEAMQLAGSLKSRPEQFLPMPERIAWVLRRQNRWLEAETFSARVAQSSDVDYSRTVQEQPELPALLVASGLAFLEEGQPFAAVDALRRAVAINPDNLDANHLLGIALASIRNWEEARRQFERVAMADASYPGVDEQLSRIMWELGDEKDSLHHARRALEREPHPELQVWLAWILCTAEQAALRNGKEAIRLLQGLDHRQVMSEPAVDEVWAAAYAEVGDYTKATDRQRQVVADRSGPAQEAAQRRLETLNARQPIRRVGK